MKRAVLCLLLVACSKKTESTTTAPADAAPPAVTASAVASASAAPAPAPPPAPVPKKYKRVLHTGDSMVGGGLSRALGPMFEADGAKYHRDVIESGTIHTFSQDSHIPELLAKVKPDLVLVSLGANHIHQGADPEKEIGPYVPKLLKRLDGIDCYWIAPPIWKPEQASFNAWLKEHVAPCKFYDGSELEIARRADKIHPNEKGGEVWAADFWKFYKGDGAFTLLPDAGTP